MYTQDISSKSRNKIYNVVIYGRNFLDEAIKNKIT